MTVARHNTLRVSTTSRLLAALYLSHIWRIFKRWLRAVRGNTQAIKQSRMLPIWLGLLFVAFDFGFLAVWYRHASNLSMSAWIVSGVLQFCVRLGLVIAALVFACRHYQVPGAALGIRPSKLIPDFEWSFRNCVMGACVIGAVIATGLMAAVWLGIRLPAPPELFVQYLGGKWSVQRFLVMGTLGVAGNMLVAVTEELIYRSLFLPPLTARFGLLPAIAVTSIVFGLAHVIPFGQLGIPGPEIVGGLVMAAGFAIRWSVIPAMVIHAMGNLFAGFLIFIYVQLFQVCPGWFLGQ